MKKMEFRDKDANSKVVLMYANNMAALELAELVYMLLEIILEPTGYGIPGHLSDIIEDDENADNEVVFLRQRPNLQLITGGAA